MLIELNALYSHLTATKLVYLKQFYKDPCYEMAIPSPSLVSSKSLKDLVCKHFFSIDANLKWMQLFSIFQNIGIQ